MDFRPLLRAKKLLEQAAEILYEEEFTLQNGALADAIVHGVVQAIEDKIVAEEGE